MSVNKLFPFPWTNDKYDVCIYDADGRELATWNFDDLTRPKAYKNAILAQLNGSITATKRHNIGFKEGWIYVDMKPLLLIDLKSTNRSFEFSKDEIIAMEEELKVYIITQLLKC